MKYEKLLKRSTALADRGNLDSAIAALEGFLRDKSPREQLIDYSRASLYLGFIYHQKGDTAESIQILEKLSESAATDIYIRGHAIDIQIRTQRQLGRYDAAEQCCQQFLQLMEDIDPADSPTEYKKLFADFLSSRAILREHQGRFTEAQEDLGTALEWVISLNSHRNCSKDFTIIYINLYNLHMLLGNTDQAQEYLVLAHAKMKTLKNPYMYGLTLFLENLATHNLFAACSQREAIAALSHLNEKAVNNFADLRKVFDFFSSIIVQLHDGKIDLEKIRESIREYGDDPLIKAYLPTLLAGAPPPGSDDGDDDIPAARLT
jgi:tetratricopeptide (TPR) repeat protein